jgi:hypothetical protein
MQEKDEKNEPEYLGSFLKSRIKRWKINQKIIQKNVAKIDEHRNKEQQVEVYQQYLENKEKCKNFLKRPRRNYYVIKDVHKIDRKQFPIQSNFWKLLRSVKSIPYYPNNTVREIEKNPLLVMDLNEYWIYYQTMRLPKLKPVEVDRENDSVSEEEEVQLMNPKEPAIVQFMNMLKKVQEQKHKMETSPEKNIVKKVVEQDILNKQKENVERMKNKMFDRVVEKKLELRKVMNRQEDIIKQRKRRQLEIQQQLGKLRLKQLKHTKVFYSREEIESQKLQRKKKQQDFEQQLQINSRVPKSKFKSKKPAFKVPKIKFENKLFDEIMSVGECSPVKKAYNKELKFNDNFTLTQTSDDFGKDNLLNSKLPSYLMDEYLF